MDLRYSISAFAWMKQFEERHLSLLPIVRDMGYEGFEIPMFDPADLPIKALREALRANDLTCTICAILPQGTIPISPEVRVRKAAQQHLLACMEAAAELEATLLGGPILAPIGYFTGKRPTRDEWLWATEFCQSLLAAVDSYNVHLSIEPVNRSETHFIKTAQDALYLLESVNHPKLGITLDTFHANIEEKHVAQAVALLGNKLFHVHLSENDRGVIGSGHFEFWEILAALKGNSYQGLLTVEGFAFDSKEALAPGYLQADPSTSPLEFAEGSLRYLKQQSASLASVGPKSA